MRTHSDYDFPQARTDRAWRHVTAELAAAEFAHHRQTANVNQAKIYTTTVRMAALNRHLVDRGHDEYRADLDEATRALDEMRAEDEMRSAAAPFAIGKFVDDSHRLEFAVLARRLIFGCWPTPDEVIGFMGDAFGMTVEQACDVLTDAYNNYDQAACGVYMSPSDDMVELMGLPMPADDARLYVDAETQFYCCLHRIFDAWAYESFTTDIKEHQ